MSNTSNLTSYRVIQSASQGQQGSSTAVAGAAPTVLTSPLNGQFYVIGTPQDVLGTSSDALNAASSTAPRALAPRLQRNTTAAATVAASAQAAKAVTGVLVREERRRATHNEVERRRRDNINTWITKLGKLMPDTEPSTGGEAGPGSYGKGQQCQSKGGILAKACEYVVDLREENARLVERLQSGEGVESTEKEMLEQTIEDLKSDNAELIRTLRNHGIPIPPLSSMDSLLNDMKTDQGPLKNE